MSYDILGKAIDKLLKVCAILLFIFVPLGLWKIVDIVVWLWDKFSITIN